MSVRKTLRQHWFRELVELFTLRRDLRGVSSTADYLEESVRWSA